MVTTVLSKGQAVIPKNVREALGILPGTRIDFAIEGRTALVVPMHTGTPARVEDGFRMLKYQGPAVRIVGRAGTGRRVGSQSSGKTKLNGSPRRRAARPTLGS